MRAVRYARKTVGVNPPNGYFSIMRSEDAPTRSVPHTESMTETQGAVMEESFVPPVAIADPADAQLLFNVVNAVLVGLPFNPTHTERPRLNALLVSLHAETKRTHGETAVEVQS